MYSDIKQKILAFFCGDAVVTIWIKIGGILSGVTQLGFQVLTVVVLGIAGGMAGIAGKDIYAYVKATVKKRLKK